MDNKKKKQKVQMPASMRKKLMAATSMLLVSAIMLVSSSYAWFTLSTAPEVTGITTSVGANGNLEIALLTTDTFANPDQITSNTSDSMEANGKSALTANITWGNLVDLSDTSYGLNQISLLPSSLNMKTDEGSTVLDMISPLQTPEYGSDGRVSKLEGNTQSAVYENGVFSIADTQSYGVRAVGTSSDISARTITFKGAKGTYQSKVNGIPTPIRTAVSANITPFLTLAAAGSSPTSYTYEQVSAMKDIATSVQTSLNNIVSAYANAGLAKAASSTGLDNDDDVAALKVLLTGVTNAATLQSILSEDGGVNDYSDELTTLASQQTAVANVLAAAEELLADNETKVDYTTTDDLATVKDDIIKPLLGDGFPMQDENGEKIEDKKTILSMDKIYLIGGAVATVANYAGTFELTTQLGITVYAGTKDGVAALDAVTAAVNALEAKESAKSTNITDEYGYILDFAFRTNATNSHLQLQTAAVNRVYSDLDDATLATQGAGSTVTFNYAESGLTSSQATGLLDAVRVVFFNPESGEIYKTAKLGGVSAGSSSATGYLYIIANEETAYELGKDAYTKTETTEETGENDENGDPITVTTVSYVLNTGFKYGNTVELSSSNCTNYFEELTEERYMALKASTIETTKTTLSDDKTAITALAQNTVQKISVMVYLAGENIDNSSVAYKTKDSGTLKLNLQFSSSANLTPMENNALKTLEKSTTGSESGTENNTSSEGDTTT